MPLVLLGSLMLSPARAASASQHGDVHHACTRTLAKDAGQALGSLKRRLGSPGTATPGSLWKRYSDAIARYGPCDDGVIAEFFAEVTGAILTTQWNTAYAYISDERQQQLKAADFMVAHVSSVITPDVLHTLREHARNRCQPAAAAFCARVASAADAALDEQQRYLNER